MVKNKPMKKKMTAIPKIDVLGSSFRRGTIKSCNDIIIRLRTLQEFVRESITTPAEFDSAQQIAFMNAVGPIMVLTRQVVDSGWLETYAKQEQDLIDRGFLKKEVVDVKQQI